MPIAAPMMNILYFSKKDRSPPVITGIALMLAVDAEEVVVL